MWECVPGREHLEEADPKTAIPRTPTIPKTQPKRHLLLGLLQSPKIAENA